MSEFSRHPGTRRGASSENRRDFAAAQRRPWPGVGLSPLSEVSYVLAATTAATVTAVAAFVSHASGAAGAKRGAAA